MQKIRELFEGINGVRGVSVTFTGEEVEVVVFIECDKWNHDRILELLHAENEIREKFPEIKFSFKRFWVGGKDASCSKVG
jgi:hypothetical protein